jgi:membrane protease YdiL (CAAX protease family)
VFAVLVGVAYSVTESLLVAVAAHSMTNMGELFRDPLLDGFFNVYPTFGPTEGTVAAALSLILILAAARATKRLDL